jgi:periplasmic protein TonB
MSTDPKTNPPPAGGPKETLEDLIYRPNLSSGNSGVHRASPWVTVPTTVMTYGLFTIVAIMLAKHTDAGKKLIKTVGIVEGELKEEDAPPPPPPPPPAPAPPPMMARPVETQVAPPPPPIDPHQEIVPDVAPRALPTKDQSTSQMQAGGSGTGTGMGVLGGGVAGTGMAVAGSGNTTRVVDFDFSQIVIKHQPPAPPYPALAKIAKIQGTVVVEIVVGTDGVPTSAKAVEGPPQLRATAENYALQWRFEPAKQNGVPQIARFKLTMPFKLK